MASNYVTLDSYRDVQVLSASQVRDVQVVSFATKPSGVTASRAVPYQEWINQTGFDVIEQTASAIEDLISGGLASSGQGSEDVDANGLIMFVVEFVVEATAPTGIPGPFRTTVTIPVESLTLDTGFGGSFGGITGVASPADQLSAAYQALLATIAA